MFLYMVIQMINGVKESGRPADKPWVLDVQGERFQWDKPEVTVREALERAGYDLGQSWILTLKVGGEPKRSVGLDDVINLTHPGLERLRVLKGQVNNGDAALPRREFELLPKDHAYLDGLGFRWETVQQGRERWLLLRDYVLPAGYTQTSCTIAVSIPANYPAAKLDMFFCAPHLERVDKKAIDRTESRQAIDGVSFQRWSRHPAAAWNADTDSIRTHMALVEESICREVEQ
ncbi:multiubiquitin domain-containing protein [Microbulbifer litoralis]|uniref:multiubiquitin domain-containing protein n=1 Tax=Microbulbifer litoralis TaxID=2933965 RepID=UPI002027C52E|nr:multiubiquitin domain-containing protein [Microbulbifer sp. GX H0434]